MGGFFCENMKETKPMIPGVWYIKGIPRPEINTPLEGLELIRKLEQQKKSEDAQVVSKK